MSNSRNNTKVQDKRDLENYLLEVEVEHQHIASANTRISYSLDELEAAVCIED